MQTEQETSIQQCKENNKKLVKLNVQNILNQNSFDRDINFLTVKTILFNYYSN